MTIHILSLAPEAMAIAEALGWQMVWNETHGCVASYLSDTTNRYYNSTFLHPAKTREEAVAVATEGLKVEAVKQIREAEDNLRLQRRKVQDTENFLARVKLATAVKAPWPLPLPEVTTVKGKKYIGGLGDFVLEGEFNPGCLPSGFGGPPENYDPGEPDYVDLVRVTAPNGEVYTYDQFRSYLLGHYWMDEEGADNTIEAMEDFLLLKVHAGNRNNPVQNWEV